MVKFAANCSPPLPLKVKFVVGAMGTAPSAASEFIFKLPFVIVVPPL